MNNVCICAFYKLPPLQNTYINSKALAIRTTGLRMVLFLREYKEFTIESKSYIHSNEIALSTLAFMKVSESFYLFVVT